MAGEVKIGVIGVGAIGSVHTDAYAKVDAAEVVALCDILPDRLKQKSARHGVSTLYEDYHQLLADPGIDAVSVCVPNCLHCEITVAALEAGKHVICEKPMAMSAAEAIRMCEARDRAGKVLQIGMVMRQKPESVVVRETVESGALGDIYHIRVVLLRRRGIPGMGGWFTTKAESGGGPLIDIGVHFFDLSMWLSGLWNPTAVSASTYDKFGPLMEDYNYVSMWAGPPKYDGVFDVEDYACGTVRFGGGASMSFDVGWAANTPGESYVELLGDKGGVRIGAGPTTLLTEVGGRVADVKLQYATEGDGFATQLTKFAAATRGEGEPPATGEQGVVAMKLIGAIYASAAAGREVTIE